jgi:hypothetical protein
MLAVFSGRTAAIKLRHQMPGEIRRIVSGADNLLRLSATQEWQAHDVKTWCVYNTAMMTNASTSIEDRNIQP